MLMGIQSSFFSSCHAQPSFTMGQLKLIKTIPLPGVKGRIDHMDVNLKDQVIYVAALGNNTLEVVDLVKGKVIHSIEGLDEPQGVGYIPQTGEVFVANGGNGDGYFFNAHNFEKVAKVHLGSDADDVRYDSSAKKIYVGFGQGGIAVLDASNHVQIVNIRMPAHPESFQMDNKLQRMFVNLPDERMVGVVSLPQSRIIGTWINRSAGGNFPMALDTVRHRVFVGYRDPARLVVFDGRSGNQLASVAMIGDADDLYYDQESGKVFVSGGAGEISIFQDAVNGALKPTANFPTRNGARTSLLVPQLGLLIVAARATSGKPASLLVYTITP